MSDKIKACPVTGHLQGDSRVETHYMKNGFLSARIPVEIKFDKPEAVMGEIVTILGVPKDAKLVFRNEITESRQFGMDGESVRVHLVGKYRGMARSIRVSEEALKNKLLLAAMVEFFSQTEKGKAILEATSVDQLRKI